MLLQAVVLGIIQGITEFLPISSSGHLVLVPYLFNFPDQGLAVDAVLHLMTGLAIVLYFWRDWWNLLINFRKDQSWRKIVGASLPAVLVGVLLDNWIENTLRSPWVVVAMLVSVAGLMWWVESNYVEVKKLSGKESHSVVTIPILDALIIGVAQVLALIPGTSRSGITISAGMWRSISRYEAAKFSFMIGAPITLGAGAMKLTDLFGGAQTDWTFMGTAAVVTFVTALISIHWLLKFLNRGSLKPFIWYRFALAVIVAYLLVTHSI